MIDISKLVATIGDDVCQGLVEVGPFPGNGKLIALKIVKSDNDAKQEFTELSQSWDLSDDLFPSIEKVTRSFYSSGANASDMNDHRYIHFFAKNGEIESHQLPPCKVSLQRTPCGQTFKRVFGGAVCSVAHQSSTQLDSDGAWEAQRKTNQVCQLTGWIESLLPRQCWSFLHADRADFQTAFTWRTP